MTDVVASGILNSLLDRLTGRMVVKSGWLTDVGAELKKLEGTLSNIRDVLEDAEARQVQEKVLTGWLRRLKDVAYDIDDLLDEDFAKNRKRSAPESSTSWMKEKVINNLISFSSSIMSQYKISREIREIRERLDELAEERSKFHLQERSVVILGREEDRVREETGSFVIESEVYGREEDKKKIIEFLVDTSGGDLGVIAIVGMGGLGKTTLAQLVYNDQQISTHFEEKMKIWVCVSDDFDLKRLVRSIKEQLTGRRCDLTSMASMESKLKQELEKKKFLLVLDDVWNENYEKWDRLRSLLTIGARGSKVIVTTRDGRIASLMATVEPHFLKGLSEDHCLLLFEKRAFGIGACEKTANLVTIGKEIVKKCGGVPLAAKVLGSLMRSKEGESEWLAVRDNDSWKSQENDHILPALRLSYNHLPSHLKQCFAYFSMFPKDTPIKDATLVELWIAEGFIRRPNKNVKLEDVGYQYLRELLSRSLFEKSTTWSCIKIHDLVHDLAQSISGEECSSIDIASNKRDIYPTMTRYSSFTYTKEATPLILDILNEAKKLRTFYFLNSYPYVEIRTEDMMRKFFETVFSSMKLLRALHISYYGIKELPMSISKLRHLRYLNLSSRDLETLPHSIGFLHNLHFLKLPNCYSLKELPDSIGNLSNLLTLNLESCHSLVSLPTSIGHLKILQTLNLESSKIEKLPESLCCLSDLRSINLSCCDSLLDLPENMKDMKSLTNLGIRCCDKLTGMPSGIGQLSHLRELPLFVLSEKSECGLRELIGLNLLEGQLYIRNLENVKNFQEARDANLIEKHGLEFLWLSWGLDTYKRQVEACVHTDQEGESRQDLIRALALAEKVLEGLQPHQNLRELHINGYLGKIFPKWLESSSLPNLVSLWLISCFRCETLPEISQLHNLRTLSLGKLPVLKSIPPLGHLPYLESLTLEYLLAVKSLGSEFYGTGDGAFPALRWLTLEFRPYSQWWRDVIGIKDVFKGGTSYRIGDGNLARFWSDRWCGESTLQSHCPELFSEVVRKSIKVRACYLQGRWRWRMLLRGATVRGLVGRGRVNKLKGLVGTATPGPGRDELVWRWDKKGCFTVKSTYAFLIDGGTRDLAAPSIWRLRVPSKVKIFIWIALKNRLPTTDRLVIRGWCENNLCVLCGVFPETADHLFTGCVFVRFLFGAGVGAVDIRALGNSVRGVWESQVGRETASDSIRSLTSLAAHWWVLWNIRNKVIFKQTNTDPLRAVRWVSDVLALWSSLGS